MLPSFFLEGSMIGLDQMYMLAVLLELLFLEKVAKLAATVNCSFLKMSNNAPSGQMITINGRLAMSWIGVEAGECLCTTERF